MHPKVGQIWLNKGTNLYETIIKVGDRVITKNFDCHYELFLETYSIDIQKSIDNLQKRVNYLLDDIEQLKKIHETDSKSSTFKEIQCPQFP